MSRVFIRFAIPRDTTRLVRDGVLTGTPAGDSWQARADRWLAEHHAGRRVFLVAEDISGILGTVQLVFAFPDGYADPEAANGDDVAMVEMLRTRPRTPPAIADRLIADVQNLARKRNVRTLTFCIPVDNDRAIVQARAWGFEEFRIMPEQTKTVAFFRKSLQ